MAQTITVIDKASKATTTVTGQEVTLTNPSVVELPVQHGDIKSMARKGGDLLVTTADGQTTVIHGYFADGQSAASSLVAQDDNGLWAANLTSLNAGDASIDTAAAGSDAFSSVSSLNSLETAAPAATDSTDALASTADPAAATDSSAAAAAGDTTAASTNPAIGTVAGDAVTADNPNWLPPVLAAGGFATALAVAALMGGPGLVPPPPVLNVAPDPDGTITASGTTDAGNTVNVTFPDGSTASTTADSNGDYSVQSALPQTTGQVAAQAINSNGPSGPTTVDYVDTYPPLSPDITSTIANADGSLTVAGTAEALSTVTVTFPDGSTATMVVGDGGTFSVTSAAGVDQPPGTGDAISTDQAGNVSQPADYSYGQAITMAAVATDAGKSASDFITDDNTLALVGTLQQAFQSGDQVKVSLDGGQTWQNAVATAGDSTWTFDNTNAPITPDGNYIVNVELLDSSGNVIGFAAQKVEMDTTAPTETVTCLTATSALISGAISSTLDSGSAPGVSQEYVQVSTDGGRTWNDASMSSDGTSWSYAPATPLPNGSYTVEARVVDAAGNAGAADIQTVPITDATAPAITIGAIASDTGQSASDFVTDDATLVLTGALATALAAGQTVQVSTDGGTSWHAAAISSNGTTWTYDDRSAALPQGDYTVEARIVDASGNALATASQTVLEDN
ncbi:MAG: Ig-like domain-containing protein, partial [Burkholderiaceae bacterium]|nr:Ig-like domain-containing protein [Burkholderiaceae bacterium]